MKMLSTMSNPLTTQSVERKQKDGSKVMVPCPDAVVVYNKFMGGVDKGDQLRHYYRIRTKCVKNYKYIFWFLVDMVITNAHIIGLPGLETCTSVQSESRDGTPGLRYTTASGEAGPQSLERTLQTKILLQHLKIAEV